MLFVVKRSNNSFNKITALTVKMIRRNGGTPKVVAGVIVFFGFVYFIYLYNDLSGQLKNTENSAARYRRDAESASAQLQVQKGHTGRLQTALQAEKLKYKASLDEMILAKNELQQKCDNEKEQMTNRLNSQQQQFKMLKSQHEDLESEFGRLQNEKEKEVEDHKKQDDERAIEYSQYKQEKMLEMSNLKDTVANLEREKEQLTQQISELKQQLQNSLLRVSTDNQTIIGLQSEIQTQKVEIQKQKDLVQQAQTRQQQIEQQYQQLQQQVAAAQQQQGQQQQQQQQGINNVQGGGGVGGGIGVQQGLNAVGGAGGLGANNMQQGGLQHPGEGMGLFGDQIQQNVQHVMQGLKEQIPQDGTLGKFIQGANNLHQNMMNPQGPLQPIVGHNPQQDNKNDPEPYNIADDILKSLQDKHKPVDANIIEEQQKQHQIIPPHEPEPVDDDQQKHDQNLLVQEGHGIQNLDPEQGQIGRPDLNAGNDGHSEDKKSPAPAAGDHDNRIENQGPVNLQVQEPNMHGDNGGDNNGELKFRPNIQVPVDNQMQPQAGLDDTRHDEQMDIPIGRDKNMDDKLLDRKEYNEEDEDKPVLPNGQVGRV